MKKTCFPFVQGDYVSSVGFRGSSFGSYVGFRGSSFGSYVHFRGSYVGFHGSSVGFHGASLECSRHLTSNEIPNWQGCPEVTPEAFLDRFWQGVSLAEPSYTPEDLKEAWECAKHYQRIQDGADYAHFLENWNQELENIANFQEADLNQNTQIECQLEDAAALELEKFLNALVARQQQTDLAELQASGLKASILESEAELSAEILDAEMRSDFEKLMPSYINLPERAKPFKPIVLESYIPKRAVSGYTIGPDGGDSGGWGGGSNNDGGGSNWGDDGGGSNWNDDGGGSNWNSGAFFILVLTGSGIIFMSRIMYRVMGDYGSKLIAAGLDKFLLQSEKQLKSEKSSLKAALPALVPVVLTSSGLVVLSYVLHPDRLRELIARLEEAIIVIVDELGRVIMALIPPQLYEIAEQIGRLIEQIGEVVHFVIHDIAIPVALFVRRAAILAGSIFFVFKLTQLGYQVVGVVQANRFSKAVAESLYIPSENLIEDFVAQYLKAVSIFLIPILPIPSVYKRQYRIVRLLYGSIILILVSRLSLTHLKLFGVWLLSNPELNLFFSSIAGRYSVLAITTYYANQDKALCRYMPLFGLALYVFRVYQLAYTATPNLFPI